MKIAGKISVFVLLLFVALFSGVALAEEKSVSCPANFDPDNSAWAMHKISVFDEGSHILYARRFSYFPDSEERILVHLKKLYNQNCFAMLYSYGPKDGVGEKRVLASINPRLGSTRYYLFTQDGWEQGDDFGIFEDCDTKESCNIVFTLYKEKVPIASRVVDIKN